MPNYVSWGEVGFEGIVIFPDEKIIALGAVATGSIKAQLAASVTGTQSSIGSIPDSPAIAPITGRKVAVVARLLVISVKKTTSAVAPKIIMTTPRATKGARPSPNQ